MPDDTDAQILQVLSRQARKNRFVNLVLAERCLILPKAKASQPNDDVHDGAPNSGLPHIIVQPGESVQDAWKLRGSGGQAGAQNDMGARYAATRPRTLFLAQCPSFTVERRSVSKRRKVGVQ